MADSKFPFVFGYCLTHVGQAHTQLSFTIADKRIWVITLVFDATVEVAVFHYHNDPFKTHSNFLCKRTGAFRCRLCSIRSLRGRVQASSCT